MAFFPGFSSSSAFLVPFPLILLSLTGSTSSSERLSLLRSGLALPQSRCAIRGSVESPIASAKASGMPKRVIETEGEADDAALRARRSAHESRKSCPLCTGKRSSWRRMSREGHVIRSDIDTLVAKDFHQLAPMGATLPVSPQNGARSNQRLGCFVEPGGLAVWMQHRTNAPWFPGGCSVPLAALS